MLSQEIDEQWNGGRFCLKLFLVQTKKNFNIYLSIYIRFVMPFWNLFTNLHLLVGVGAGCVCMCASFSVSAGIITK